MNVDSLQFLVCHSCRRGYPEEHGYSVLYCSEECSLPPSEREPDDDDGYDGLPFDPETTVRHHVYPRYGCDIRALPYPWQAEAEIIRDRLHYFGRSYRKCCCWGSHTVLSRDEVRALRHAGFEVTLEDSHCDDDRGYDDYDRPYGYGDDHLDYDPDYRYFVHHTPTNWLEGRFSTRDEPECREYWEGVGRDQEQEEAEVLRSMGFEEWVWEREIREDDPPPPAPKKTTSPKMECYIVGVFKITRKTEDPWSSPWVLKHRFGGLVPTDWDYMTLRPGYATAREFFDLDLAIQEAERAMRRLGVSSCPIAT
jgi:hypothetical protein